MMSLRRPVPFGKYLLLDRIAIGGMAEIFRAKTTGAARFEKIIAIKRIHPNMSEDKDFIRMFIDEAKIAGQLNHPNIAQIYELGRIEGHHFIAMEFIWGKDLLQILSKFKKNRAYMNPYQSAFITTKICEALDYAHKKRDAQGQPMNIIHRDISPQNILISYDGDIKIIDFGIAKARDRSSHTAAGVLKGKFAYMSPEQVRGLPIDRRSDIFAIGTLLFEMLTSRPLFSGDSDLTVLEKVRNVEIPKPRDINKEIPAEMERIILKALTRDVEERYQWASEMQEDLERYMYTTQPIYTSKRLGTWMQKVFQAEREKEKAILDEMLNAAEEMMQESTSGKTMANTAVAARPGPQQNEIHEGATVIVDDEEDREPGQLAKKPPLPVVSDIHDERTRFLEDDDEEPDEQATRILEDDEDAADMVNAAGAPLSEQKTMIYDEDNPEMNVPVVRPQSIPPGMTSGVRPPMPLSGGMSRPPMPNPYPQPPVPPPSVSPPSSSVPDIAIPGLDTPSRTGAIEIAVERAREELQSKWIKITIATGIALFMVGLILGIIIG